MTQGIYLISLKPRLSLSANDLVNRTDAPRSSSVCNGNMLKSPTAVWTCKKSVRVNTQPLEAALYTVSNLLPADIFSFVSGPPGVAKLVDLCSNLKVYISILHRSKLPLQQNDLPQIISDSLLGMLLKRRKPGLMTCKSG